MHPYVNVAVTAARKAGQIILQAYDNLDTLKISAKGQNDFVTHVDEAVEQIIIKHIQKGYPDHAIYGEESGALGSNETVWVIDPIDGTTNFIHGFPQFAVSIGIQHKDRLEHAVIYDPFKDELFTATKGQGAQFNGRRMRVSARESFDLALFGTGFPYSDMQYLEPYLALFREICPMSAGIRRAGSAALDLAYVAAGRLDAFWEIGLKPWDMAAGTLLIQEAGGLVTTFKDTPLDIFNSQTILAGNPKMHKQVLDIITTHFKPNIA